VIGGLAASTLITLVFVPTLYTIFEEGLTAFRREKRPATSVDEHEAPAVGH
jgi:hypothetical protein